jgi:hypothetical protein
VSDDPVRVRRAQAARLAEAGQRVGYALVGVAVAAFAIGAVQGFGRGTADAEAVVTAALVATTLVLAPAIVLGYAVKAAEREDHEQGR